MRFRDSWFSSKLRVVATVLAALLWIQDGAGAPPTRALRSDKLSLSGRWKFQLRRDNQLHTAGVVKFGPLTASSQFLFKEPGPGESPLARLNLAQPWGLAATSVGPGLPRDPAPAIWKSHPQQQGPTWWLADLGSNQTLDSLRVNWVKPGEVKVSVEISQDGSGWSAWTSGKSRPDEYDTTLHGPRAQAQFVRLTFTPVQFEGTRKIEIRLHDRLGRLTLWQPAVRKAWYDDLRAYTPDGFQLASYNDSSWSAIQIPGYWEAQGHGQPDWFQPNDEVGYYRRTFTLPEAWRGRHVRLRFEAVNNGAEVWVNGHRAGYHEGGYTPFEYDVTSLVRFGAPNLIAVRVAKHTLTCEYETDDAFFLGGFGRDVYLYSLPADHIEDYDVHTTLDEVYQDALLTVELQVRSSHAARPVVAEGVLLDAAGKKIALPGFRTQFTLAGANLTTATLNAVVKNPRKWTGETPYLYTLILRLRADGEVIQEIKTHVGFRKVEAKGMRLLVNGVPIEIRGVVTVRMNPSDSGEPLEKIFAREVRLLKENNINALRSHTVPLEEEFLDLCDKHGFYVLPDVPYVWATEEDYKYLSDDLVQRTKEIFDSHKNHPSVILWHVGNENHPTTAYLGGGQAARWLSANDPTRPVAVCRNLADAKEMGTTVSDLHYDPMTYPEFRELYPSPLMFGEFHAVPNEIRRLKDLGFVETWGRSLQREWMAYRERYFYVVGGLICCWEDGAVNGDLGFNQWGLVDSKHHAKPVLNYVRKSYAPVELALHDLTAADGGLTATLKITNHYNFLNLDGFAFKWELRAGTRALASGQEAYRVASRTSYSFPWSVAAPPQADRVHFSVNDADGYSIYDIEYPLPASAAPASVQEFLARLAIGMTAGAIQPGDFEIVTRSYRASATPDGRLRINDEAGRGLLTLDGLAMDAEETSWSNLLSGTVQHQPPQLEKNAVMIGLKVSGGTKDKKQTWEIPGAIRIEFGESWIRIAYTLRPDRELSIPEAGLRLILANRLTHLSWNRQALWSTAPEIWRDGTLEEHVSLDAFRATVSKRNVLWALLEGSGTALLLVPLGPTTNLRAEPAAGEMVVSDFLAAGNFLGKFDKETTEKKIAAGEKLHGGFTLYFLSPEQKSRLEALPPAQKDLTWAPRAKVWSVY